MLPRVVIFNAVSLDARIDWFTPNIGQFYDLASRWGEDCTLAGSETILEASLEAPEDDPAQPVTPPDPADTRPLLAVVDGRGRVRRWQYWRGQPYWRDVVALCSESTPADYFAYLRERKVEYVVAGHEQVDLRAALEALNERKGVRLVRADSGGTLNGALLRAGLVDEVSLLVSPCLVGGVTPRSFFRAPDLTSGQGVIELRLQHLEQLDGDTLWLRYQVVR